MVSVLMMDADAFTRMLFDGLLDFQRRGVLCDTILRAQGGEVLANSAVLAAASSKLRRELIRPDTEPGTQHIVELPDFCAEDVCRMLEYINSGLPGDSELDPSGVVALCETLEIPVPPVWIDCSSLGEGFVGSLASLIIDSASFMKMILECLADFQQRGVLCDTMLRAQGSGEVLAHSVMLAASSAKLKRELIRPESEPGTQHIVELPDFAEDDVRRMILYIYSGSPDNNNEDHSGVVALCETLEVPLPPVWLDMDVVPTLTVLKTEAELLAESATNDDSDLSHIVSELNGIDATDGHIYKCDVCSRAFKRLAALRLHSRSHVGLQIKKEPTRSKKFVAGKELITVNDDGSNDGFVYGDDVLAHLEGNNLAGGDGSRQRFVQWNAVTGPFKPNRRECKICGAEFECSAELYVHRRREHTNKDEFAYVCDCCERRFEFPSLLFEHRAMHDHTVCDECNFQFLTFRELYNHRVSVHLNELGAGPLNLCRVCGRRFESRLELRQHRLTHLQCSSCSAWFSKPSKLRRHEPCCRRRHSRKAALAAANEAKKVNNGDSSEGYLCGECGKHFERRSSYISHKKIHVSADYYEKLYAAPHHTCQVGDDFCGQAFRKPSRLERHVAGCQVKQAKRWTNQDANPEVLGAVEVSVIQPTPDETAAIEKQLEVITGQFTCADCGRVFDKMASLASHKKVHAPDEFRCAVCDKVFPKRYYLVAHERKHSNERPFSCEQCGLCFKQPGQVARHCLRRHSGGVRPHMCPTCGRTFTVKSDLKDHARIHTGERAHMCDQCGRRFRTRGILRVHERQHTGAMPFACAYCGRRFAQLSNRLKHEVIHTGEFPVSCDQCGRGFADTSALRRHQLYHTGARPHGCPICGRTFALKSSLKAHVLIHSKIRQHVCPVCQKSFVLRNGLMRHLKIHVKKGLSVPEIPKLIPDIKPQYITYITTNEAGDSGDEVSYEPEVMHEMYIAENVVEVSAIE